MANVEDDDGAGSASDNGGTALKVTSTLPVKCELLCFLKDKSDIIPFDSLVKVCVDFYQEREILEARDLIGHAGMRTKKRKGPGRLQATVEDLLNYMLNPGVNIPTYYAVDLARLPPTDITHCDMAAFLTEIKSLRQEVREMQSMKLDILKLRKEVLSQQSNPVGHDLLHAVNSCDSTEPRSKEIKSYASCLTTNTAVVANPALTARQSQSVNTKVTIQKRFPKAAGKEPVVGSSTENKHVTSVQTSRMVNVFVSRLHPTTSEKELRDCVMQAKGELDISKVVCEKLTSKMPEVYASYHVTVMVNSTQMKLAIDTFMSSHSWPSGIFVKRYFKPPNGAT